MAKSVLHLLGLHAARPVSLSYHSQHPFITSFLLFLNLYKYKFVHDSVVIITIIIILMTLLLFLPNTLKVKCLRMTEKRHFSFLQKTWQKLYSVAELTLLMFELKPIL